MKPCHYLLFIFKKIKLFGGKGGGAKAFTTRENKVMEGGVEEGEEGEVVVGEGHALEVEFVEGGRDIGRVWWLKG